MHHYPALSHSLSVVLCIFFWLCQLFVGGGGVGASWNPRYVGGSAVGRALRTVVVVASTSSVARAEEHVVLAARRPWMAHKSCCCRYNFSLPSLWHNFRFVWKENLSIQEEDDTRSSRRSISISNGRQPRFVCHAAPQQLAAGERDSLERLSLEKEEEKEHWVSFRVTPCTREMRGPTMMMDSFGRFWSLSGAALRTRCG